MTAVILRFCGGKFCLADVFKSIRAREKPDIRHGRLIEQSIDTPSFWRWAGSIHPGRHNYAKWLKVSGCAFWANTTRRDEVAQCHNRPMNALAGDTLRVSIIYGYHGRSDFHQPCPWIESNVNQLPAAALAAPGSYGNSRRTITEREYEPFYIHPDNPAATPDQPGGGDRAQSR